MVLQIDRVGAFVEFGQIKQIRSLHFLNVVILEVISLKLQHLKEFYGEMFDVSSGEVILN